MENFIFYSYLSATLAYCAVIFLALRHIKKSPYALFLAITLVVSAVWSGYITWSAFTGRLVIADALPFETARNGAWFGFITAIISQQQFGNLFKLFSESGLVKYVLLWFLAAWLLECIQQLGYLINLLVGTDLRLINHVLAAALGLILVEQCYRNANREQRWMIKFLCLGLGAMFIVDFFIYSKSLLFSKLDSSLWNSRGLLNAAVTPLIAISVARLNLNPDSLHTPRKVVFHTTVLVGTGLYLLLMSLAGFYIRDFGGNWGQLAQIIFIFLALLLLIILFASGKIRALAKVYFNKHFFHYRYDYREEWLKLSKSIAQLNSIDSISGFTINTLSDLVDSSGGGLWLKNQQGEFYLAKDKNLGFQAPKIVGENDSLIEFLTKKQWVIDFIEYQNTPDMYDEVDLSPWLSDDNPVWLIIPLFQQNELTAFAVLTQARVPRQMNWEDHDLLKTAGMQLANALALSHTSDELARSRQFEAYNRLSAYIVHDLKNLVAQISLIVKNAPKHKHNPEFIDDTIDTLENVVHKMQHLVDQFKKGQLDSGQAKINLLAVIGDVARQQAGNKPPIQIITRLEACEINGEQHKLTAILGHLAQNAQEATDDDGEVKIELTQDDDYAVIKIIDTGVGMDEKFIAERLFKPFDTTKGNAGMGIGVYEARDYIVKHHGDISVISKPDAGSTFTIRLPLAVKKTDT
ncbi:MAG: PEP-CTERM system histidine kinase PrsK [Methylobacter sp.]|nr:MAG: PEP-CTERM system histidine kinase PrsK [Methylobacter sp.]PPD21649.1 MAG: PEP-CTERM system histidine kinase PrsK [Methylobacter sp.]